MVVLACEYFEYYSENKESISVQKLETKFNEDSKKRNFFKAVEGLYLNF